MHIFRKSQDIPEKKVGVRDMGTWSNQFQDYCIIWTMYIFK